MQFDQNTHSLDFLEMDNTHKEFVDIYNSLEDTSPASYKNVMVKLFVHTKVHFRIEEENMLEHNYPRKKEHMDEHKKVLAEMEYFIQKADTKMGAMFLKSYYKEKLPDWFNLHLVSMDSDLASYLKNIDA